MSRVLTDLHDSLAQLRGLRNFGLGTSGPRLRMRGSERPDDQLLRRSAHVFGSWRQLHELHYIGVDVGGQLDELLAAVGRPLCRLTLHACQVGRRDIRNLADSVHCGHQLSELGLQYNKLTGAGPELCELVLMTQLTELNLEETMLTYIEKVQLMGVLSCCQHLVTLSLYENEDWLDEHEYHHIVELCPS